MKRLNLLILCMIFVIILYVFILYQNGTKKYTSIQGNYQNEIAAFKNEITQKNDIIEQLKKDIQERDEQIKQSHNLSIDDKYSLCLENSKSFVQDYKCAYEAKLQWEKRINKDLSSLKKIMKKEDYKVVEYGQMLWKKSAQQEIKMIEKFIVPEKGAFNQSLGQKEIMNINRDRALFLEKIEYFYKEYSDTMEYEEKQ